MQFLANPRLHVATFLHRRKTATIGQHIVEYSATIVQWYCNQSTTVILNNFAITVNQADLQSAIYNYSFYPEQVFSGWNALAVVNQLGKEPAAWDPGVHSSKATTYQSQNNERNWKCCKHKNDYVTSLQIANSLIKDTDNVTNAEGIFNTMKFVLFICVYR